MRQVRPWFSSSKIGLADGAINIGKPAPIRYGVDFVDKMGVEDARGLVILAWDPEWWYYIINDVGIHTSSTSSSASSCTSLEIYSWEYVSIL